MKGRIVWVFWLVVVLAVLASTASYAWLAMNTVARMRGFEVELESDSLYLEISDSDDKDYGKAVYFDSTTYYSDKNTHETYLVSYGQVRPEGGLLLYPTLLSSSTAPMYGDDDGKYNGGNTRFYLTSESVIGGGMENFIDVTENLHIGQSLIGYYVVHEGVATHPTSMVNDKFYYVKTERGDGSIDYSCIGKFDIGETIAGRRYWGYSTSKSIDDSQPNNIMNVVSLDTPSEEYCLKKTVYLRGARGSKDLANLRVSSVEVDGKNYLTDAVRVLFVATSETGAVASTVYSHRTPSSFNGMLLGGVLGNEREIVRVDMYIYFDGKDEAACSTDGILTEQTVSVKFTVDDRD